MTHYSYKKDKKKFNLESFRIFAILLIFLGIGIISYISFPLLSWRFYFTPIFTPYDLTSPIPKTTIVTKETVKTILARTLDGADYTNAQNWFPSYRQSIKEDTLGQKQYYLTIPKLGITNSIVSTTDYDLSRHLVHYGGTSLPPENGNAVIFGHSTLPTLFNPQDYKTIFATLYKLGLKDEVIITINDVSYRYIINSITVVDPTETSIFSQDFNYPTITLVTCTPPGTTWKRLIIRGELAPLI